MGACCRESLYRINHHYTSAFLFWGVCGIGGETWGADSEPIHSSRCSAQCRLHLPFSETATGVPAQRPHSRLAVLLLQVLLSAESSLVCGVAGPNHQHLPPHPQHLLGSSTKADSTQNGVKDPAWLYALGEWHRPDCVGLLGCPPCRASSLLQVIILDTCLGIA